MADDVKFPQVTVRLSGENGNAYSILGRVRAELRKSGATKEQLEEYFKEASSGDYNNLLRVTMRWVNVK